MAIARLIPSTYYLSNTSYLSVTNTANMYNNTDNDTYATVSNTKNGTTTYYIYLRGFNFDAIPSGATINSWTVKLKARESGGNTSTSYSPKLAGGTSIYTSTCPSLTTTATVHTFTGVTATWESVTGYGDDFGIRINCRRANRNTAAHFYIYGAEIEVDYSIPDPCTITTTLTGDGTISPSGVTETIKDIEFTLTITPTDKTDPVSVTNNGVDVTSQLVAHGLGGVMNLTPDDVTTSGIQSGSSYAEYAVGHSAESPSSSGTSSNMYASSNSTGYAQYTFDFSTIPSNAIIESIQADCYGHRESSTISSTYVSNVAIVLSGTQISDVVDFPSTSNTTITVTAEQSVTRAQLDNLAIRHYVGYYGGLVLGITLKVTYSVGDNVDHYTYTFTTTDDATIAVVIGAQETNTIYAKPNDTWVAASVVFKKVGGVWGEQNDLTNVFDNSIKYVKGVV